MRPHAYDASQLMKTTDYCKYYQGITAQGPDPNFGYMVCSELGMLNVVVLSIHPSAFADKDGKIDRNKLQKLDAIVKWVKTFAGITGSERQPQLRPPGL